ncbi:hypothetical protein [Pseudoprimorskyibacter insulae]|uniref:Uncharacterized protein n=1 Tax=Pseudoprimorskyibacter insulae TaxID=1695997 RepID=A0A2R8AZ59_9RHOB|nr:hypothetical protein [Pseudoprimorskyibacter insulae]SPF81134.1 hypothetical protein PRI8871_02954 [Pseudoprimorskyibacter insulae]
MKVEEVVLAEDELSQLKVTRHSEMTVDEIDALLSEGASRNFWDDLRAFADACDTVLQEKEWPAASAKVCIEQDGTWRLFAKSEACKAKFGWKLGSTYVQEMTKDFSDAWYAARIGLKCRLALEHLNKGDGGKPFFHSMMFEIGSLRTDWRWRRSRKKQIITGRKQRNVLSDLRDAQNRTAKQNVEWRRGLVRNLISETKLTKGALSRWLQTQLKKRHDIEVSERTVRSDLKALGP